MNTDRGRDWRLLAVLCRSEPSGGGTRKGDTIIQQQDYYCCCDVLILLLLIVLLSYDVLEREPVCDVTYVQTALILTTFICV